MRGCIMVRMEYMSGAELKRRREGLNLTVPQLAEKLGVTRISLYRWEREGVRERVGMLHLALMALEMLHVKGERDGA